MGKIKIFRHNDMDGAGCSIVVNNKFGLDNVDHEICSVNDVNEKVSQFFETGDYENYDIIYISDISVNEEVAEKINKDIEEGNYKLELYDHHKTAEWLNKYSWAKVIIKNENGIKESGTSLLYYELLESNTNKTINISIEILIEGIRAYDTWDWKEHGSKFPKQLQDIYGIVGDEEFVNFYSKNYLYDLMPEIFLQLIKYKRIDIDNYIKEKLEKVVIKNEDNYNIAVVLCDRKDCFSELGSKIVENEQINYAMLIYDGGVALRSKLDFDVSVIAKKYGGGGHKNAAGFKYDKWYRWLGDWIGDKI